MKNFKLVLRHGPTTIQPTSGCFDVCCHIEHFHSMRKKGTEDCLLVYWLACQVGRKNQFLTLSPTLRTASHTPSHTCTLSYALNPLLPSDTSLENQLRRWIINFATGRGRQVKWFYTHYTRKRLHCIEPLHWDSLGYRAWALKVISYCQSRSPPTLCWTYSCLFQVTRLRVLVEPGRELAGFRTI